jgi:hypothetical protein
MAGFALGADHGDSIRMGTVKGSRFLFPAVWFLAGVLCTVVAPKLFLLVLNRVIFPEERTEVSRVTSPDGTVDAVAIRSDCGAPCSTNYSVFLVPRGTRIRGSSTQPAFSADDVSGEHLAWSQPHLLEIGYNRAFIINFQNVAYPFTDHMGNRTLQRFEIRLAPASSSFSYLKE